MGALEKYYGIEATKRISDKKLQRHSKRYLARVEETNILKQVNSLFAKGNTLQCFDLLKQAVKLVPNDYKPFFLLGLIHEENNNLPKAASSYLAAAILNKGDQSLWKKVLSISAQIDSPENEILALSKINKNEPSELLTLQKMELLKKLKKKYSVIACQIELFDYYGINNKIFDKFSKTNHINSLKKVCSSLFKCIKRNKSARTEFFMRKTMFTMYKVKDWVRILKILDEYYLKDAQVLHPDIRFIYLVAFYNVGEYRIDPLLNLHRLIEDVYIWNEMENENYVFDLCNCLKDTNEIEMAVRILDCLLKYKKTAKTIVFTADFYSAINDYENAIIFYNEAILLDPVDTEAKTKLHLIYVKLGLKDIAKEYETHKIVSEYFKQNEDYTKAGFRYSFDKCNEIRELYDILVATPKSQYEQFILNSEVLLNDFFANPFIMLKNRNFRSFTNKNEKLDFEESKSIIITNDKYSKKDVSETLIRISSLHGLDIEEWFFVVKNCILSLMTLERNEEALKLAMDGINAYIFRSNTSFVIQFIMICVRLCLMSEDFDTFLLILKDIINIYGYSSYYLCYFFAKFIPDFYLNKTFCLLQKNVQRIARRNFTPTEVVVEHRNTFITPFLSASCFLPRFVQTDTANFICTKVTSDIPNVNTAQAIISITHTKSRTLIDKKTYAVAGFKFLKNIPGDSFVKTYNLAKAYHFFGYYTHAEPLYYKVIENGPEELRKMSIFNLSLIFKQNKSKNVIKSLLSKFNS